MTGCITPNNYWSRRCYDEGQEQREVDALVRRMRWETIGFFVLIAATWIASLSFLAWKNGGWFVGGFWWEGLLATLCVVAVVMRETVDTVRDRRRINAIQQVRR